MKRKNEYSSLLVTGGAGFIGSALVRKLITDTETVVINFDRLTYAGNLESLNGALKHPRHIFEQGDICDRESIDRVLKKYKPDAIMHLAAESHVDRSIDGPSEFIRTNIIGTYNLLEVARAYWSELDTPRKENFRFHHVSTDEVYGDLALTEPAFTEKTSYDPSSPYSASKASSDHLVRAWYKTYGLPILITNCSNNYGPYQFPEKLVPLVILNAIEGKNLPIYGDGLQVRDWLYVKDHADALRTVLETGEVGETYNIGGNNEKTNIQVVKALCSILDEIRPSSKPYRSLITYVIDRPGHDKRYAINSNKISHDLDWSPQETFETGIRKTVEWYLDNNDWWSRVLDGSYQRERLGIGIIQ